MNTKEPVKHISLIAVLDDEPDIVELLSVQLKNASFKVRGFNNAEKLLRFLSEKKPNLILLDLMLPDMDGLDVCKQLKSNDAYKDIPIIMLTAKGEETDKIIGLELGADDYITKPFSPKELIARVRAVLRRISDSQVKEIDRIDISDDLVIDLDRYEVLVKGKPVQLTSTEFRILNILAERKGWVFSREKILDKLWGHEKIVVDRTVDVHIRNLREKLGKPGNLIKNVRGVGYKLEE